MKKIFPFPYRFWMRFPLYALGITLIFFLHRDEIDQMLSISIAHLLENSVRQEMQETALLLEAHYQKNGSYPAENALDTFLAEHFPDNLRRKTPIDAWGNPLIYRLGKDGSGFELKSPGKDGIPDTRDDLGMQIHYLKPRPENLPENLPEAHEEPVRGGSPEPAPSAPLNPQ